MEIGFRMQCMKRQKGKAYFCYPKMKAVPKKDFFFFGLHEQFSLLKVYFSQRSYILELFVFPAVCIILPPEQNVPTPFSCPCQSQPSQLPPCMFSASTQCSAVVTVLCFSITGDIWVSFSHPFIYYPIQQTNQNLCCKPDTRQIQRLIHLLTLS